MRNYGFIPPTIDETQFVLGSEKSLGQTVLQPDGDWNNYLPSTERQNIATETYNCTSFGTINAYETLFKRVFGENFNFSDRELGILAGTKPPGNDPHTVAETGRKSGLSPEWLLPFSSDLDTWQEYYSYQGGDENECKKARKKFLELWVMGHEWVFKGKMDKEKMREALKYSPLGISVCAWETNDKGEYISNGEPNHWTLAYKIDKEGRVYVFDSYAPHYKVLSADHDIQYCKRYSLISIKENLIEQISLAQKVVELLKKLIERLNANKTIRMAGEIVQAIFSKRQD